MAKSLSESQDEEEKGKKGKKRGAKEPKTVVLNAQELAAKEK